MSAMDRFGESEHAPSVRTRSVSFALANSATFWFALVAAGMAVLLAGLGIDAYRHNHSSAEESLLSFSNPGHLIAALGIAMSIVGALAGLTVSALRGIETRDALLRRIVPVAAAWVMIAAIGVASITYIAATGASVGVGHGHTDTTTTAAAATTHDHSATGPTTDAEAGGIVTGLQQNGVAVGSGTPTDGAGVAGALTQGADGHGGSAHDKGKQPTFTQIETMTDAQLLPLFPSGTMTLADIPTLRTQLEQVHAVALKYPTTDAAKAAGYVNTTSDVPYMGQHWISYDVIKSGKFDPNKPSGLLYSNITPGAPATLVGIWYLMVPGVGGVTAASAPSNTWAGNLALWHEHDGLCLVGLSSASEGETAASCKAKGGNYTAALKWMMHVWVAPGGDNPDGVFAYLNNDLFAKQQAAGNTGAPVQPSNGTIAQ